MEQRLIRVNLLLQSIANDETDFGDKGCAQIVKHIFDAPAINPIHAAGGCYCGECKHYKQNTDAKCALMGGLRTPSKTDFCSYGERRTE